MAKKPWLAGVLNIIPGLGYLYINWRRPFAILLTIGLALITVGVAFHAPVDAQAAAEATIWDFAAFFGAMALIAAFIVDGVQTAQSSNRKDSSQQPEL